MTKTNKIGIIFNIVLGALYLPMSLFSFLLIMASDGTIDATNALYINLIRVFCFICFVIPFLCVAGVVSSIILRIKGHKHLSFIIQFLPLIIFVLNLIFLAIVETIPIH